MGERVPLSPMPMPRMETRDTHAEIPHKQGLLEAREIFFYRGFEGQDSDRSHYDRHQEYKMN
jgi:hypothetical protein